MRSPSPTVLGVEELPGRLAELLGSGGRLAGVFVDEAPDERLRLVVVGADAGGLSISAGYMARDDRHYPSLSAVTPAAAWYEREIQDLYGLSAEGGAPQEPLLLHLAPGSPRPRPGLGSHLEAAPAPGESAPGASRPGAAEIRSDDGQVPAEVTGPGVFTLSYGPVRSGVFESVGYLLETPGEDLPSVRARVHYKHRGIEAGFTGLDVGHGVLLAERVEGVASVAHAIAFCQAVETIAGVSPPSAAELSRLWHAEIERVANHLDSMLRHTEAAGQAVAYARLSFHREALMRIRAMASGHRFSRGVVVPGGVSGPPMCDPGELLRSLEKLREALEADLELLMSTPSFLDRLRRTGVIPCELAALYGALGPLGRGSGHGVDVRASRPYSAYERLGIRVSGARDEGDALARQHVRVEEIAESMRLAVVAAEKLRELATGSTPDWCLPIDPGITGEALGSVEAPQGELITWVRATGGRLRRVKPRSASFHNFALFSSAFPKDIFTDFAFVEGSFGISIAGVAG